MKDLVDLVRAGLKPSEIREMIELEKQAKDIVIDEPTPDDDNGSKDVTEESVIKDDEKHNDDEINRLSGLLESANNEIALLKTQISELQTSNKNKDMSGESDMSIDEKVTKIISEMY